MKVEVVERNHFESSVYCKDQNEDEDEDHIEDVPYLKDYT